MMSKFGQRLVHEAEAGVQDVTGSLCGEEKRKEEMVRKIKEHGSRLYIKEKKGEIVKVQEIVCDAWMDLEKRRRQGKLCYEGMLKISGIRRSRSGGLTLSYINHSILISTYEKYKSIDIVAELVKQTFLQDRVIMTSSTVQRMRSRREKMQRE
ncbi:DUF3654 domain-containing protein [Encephalitozoon cuniculi]|nr:DUF3654 domain-containing protein [Encephalitozoon cuniculi]